MLDKFLKIKDNKVFTTVDILANSIIFEPNGDLSSKDNLNVNTKNLALQIGNDLYIQSYGSYMDYLNHNCNPNCYFHIIGNRAILYSMYLIKSGMELTFDYSSTSNESLDSWQMNCNCKSFNCRKIISGYQYLDKAMIDDYDKREVSALFLRDKRFI